jgi:zinc finger FYVE domain-containing protein 26
MLCLQVTECMCCQSVAFSMFNRRHHCRRCGRVICGSCSTRRTKVLVSSVYVVICLLIFLKLPSDFDKVLRQCYEGFEFGYIAIA